MTRSLFSPPNQAERWHTADVMRMGNVDRSSFSASDIQGFSSDQSVAFLERLAKLALSSPLHPNTTRLLNEVYGFGATKNSEIIFAFLKLALSAKDETAVPPTVAMLKSIGRMKFVRPLFRALKQSGSEEMEKVALETFEAMKDKYHPVCSQMVGRDLSGTSSMAD